ncbi:glycosyltransferase family 4 protein [Enterococcus timonensis]|uniref:glycosyltransferase family 4 protein n=1 Tax=Enterococcus timonensis TaxID=1852364 RepID=UPI0008D94233|nr:MraY family glycosyltransferase [Enterococcus timonensis]
MNYTFNIFFKLFVTFLLSLVITPLVRMLAFKIGAVDNPNARRMNRIAMPTIGGLAVFISFSISAFLLFDGIVPRDYLIKIWIGAAIIVATGMIDDVKEISPKLKTLGILIAALEIYFVAGIHFDQLTVPFLGTIHLGIFALPMTILWIMAITNAVNLIDGLDGLASGVSIIALGTIGVIGYFFLHPDAIYIPILIFILVAAIGGFFPYNFYPAKIYLGDTGALFLGFMISVLSLQGLKNATIITVITPMIILGVPITDTVFAIIRRYINNQPISSADKMHLHHRLLSLGFTHRGAVLAIYSLALLFSLIAFLLSYNSNSWGTILLILSLIFGLELFAELIGLMGPNHQPVLYFFHMIGSKEFRDQNLHKKKKK